MKKILMMVALLLGGAAVGGGAGFATVRYVAPPAAGGAAHAAEEQPTAFVPVDKILAPLVLPDGRLSAYFTFDAQLEVPADKAEALTAKLPLLLHAINMRTYRAPLAAGRDGMLPNVGGLKAVIAEAAGEAFGKGAVLRVAITRAEPA